jgi:hypothetical protein
MAKLITNAKDIATAETSDLVFTYNELEGKSVKKFENRTTAERKVEMAILAAGDRAAHRGTKVGVAPKIEDGKASAEASAEAGAEDTTEAVETPKATKADKPTAAKEKAPKAPKAAKEKAPKAAKEPKAPKAPKAAKEPKAPKAPKEPKAPHDTLVSITEAGRTAEGIRAASFRGLILASIVDAGSISKSHLVAKHQAYTADVVCKFKRLGLVTETVIS